MVVPLPACTTLPVPLRVLPTASAVVVSRLKRSVPVTVTVPSPSVPVSPPLPTLSVAPLAMLVLPS